MPNAITPNSVTADHSRSAALSHVNGRIAVSIAVVAAIAVGSVATAVVAGIAHSAGVSHTFKPLTAGAYIGLIVVGVLAGCAGWQLVRARVSDPGKVLRRLVPLVVVVSFVPDLAIGISGADHATWGGVLALMCAHVVVAAAAVTSFSVFLPAPSPSAQKLVER
jgi:uncharacterized protein DUF6069